MNIFTNQPRDRRVQTVSEAMRFLGSGCTEQQLTKHLGITATQLADVAEEACADATARSVKTTRSRVQAKRAA